MTCEARAPVFGPLAAIAVLALGPARAHAEVPPRVELLVPACAGPIDWRALEAALRIELRSMASDVGPDAPARLVLSASCDASATELEVELVHRESGRSARRPLQLGDRRDPERLRVLAVGLSEIVRAAWSEVATPPPAPPATPTREEIEAIVASAVRSSPRPEPPPPSAPEPIEPGTFVDVALATTAFVGASNATVDLRLGLSLALTALLRLGLEVGGGIGWAAGDLGDALVARAGGAVAFRLAYVSDELTVEAGPRVDAGFAHAEGVAPESGVRIDSLDAFALALGIDLRARFALGSLVHLLAGAEIGAAVAGIDARADGRRVTAELGPRFALSAGVSFRMN